MAVLKHNKKKPRSHSWNIALVFLIWLVLFGSANAPAETQRIAVLYPNIKAPYRDVFLNIIEGIEDATKESVKLYDIGEEFDEKTLRYSLMQDHVEVIIALGRRGLKAAHGLLGEFDVIAGAVFLNPDEKNDVSAGISLNPDPEKLFQRLKKLVPHVRSVSVVYNPQHSAWLIKRAEKAAHQHGISLHAIPVENLKEAASMYRDFIRGADNAQALWLIQDGSTLDKRVILAMILKKAWDKQFVVFSGNPGHVRKGALFSLYPDNIGMGRSLGSIALSRFHPEKEQDEIRPVRDLLIAVNTRTARRLNLNLTNASIREFNLVFPSK
jgi:putative ABC transport system substrate-binding protein